MALMPGWSSTSLTTRLGIVMLAALLLATLGNFIVTFSGPPPHPRPMPIEELLPVLARDRPLSRLASTTRIERGKAQFLPQPGEVPVPAAAARIDDLLPDCDGCVKLSVEPGAMIQRRPLEAPLAIRETFSLGVRRADGTWSIAHYTRRPFITGWHWATLAMTLALAVLLAGVSFRLARSIVQPLRRLAAEADRVVNEHDGITITSGGPPEVAQLAQAVSAMRDRLAGLVENRTQMLAAIAHDMAAPVSRLEFRLHQLPPEARNGAERDLAELAGMIGSIIDYARGTVGSRRRAVDMKELCANAITAVDQDEGRLAFRAPDKDCTVNGDPMTLHRLIANLAVNARRYAGGGELTLESEPERVVVRMADRGPGFPPELAENLFEPFFRVEGSRSRETAGTGLGLATARDVAKAHGGTLTATNRASGGAEFVLTLPRA